MYDIIIVGAGLAGAAFAYKTSKFANTLLIDTHKDVDSFPENVKIFIEHNRPFIEDIDFNWNDKELFPRLHKKARFMGDKVDGIIDSEEFGSPLGHMINNQNVLKFLVQGSEDHGGVSEFNKTVSKISRTRDGVEVLASGEKYKGKLVVLGTGSNAFELQNSLGFKTPDRYMGVCANLYGDSNNIDNNLDANYIFHINPKISKNGPLFINKGLDRISIGYLGDLDITPVEIIQKLEKILKNYKKIQPFIQGLKMNEKPKVASISKHPIENFSQDRALILGEAAGLVSAFFYEGIVCGFCCADIASKTVKTLLDHGNIFSHQDLKTYDDEIKRILLSKFFKNGAGSEYMFYNTPNSLALLWDTYLKVIKTNRKLRKYIYDFHLLQDLSKYDLSRDRWAGERIFAKLPMISKITLGPKFLKAMFKL